MKRRFKASIPLVLSLLIMFLTLAPGPAEADWIDCGDCNYIPQDVRCGDGFPLNCTCCQVHPGPRPGCTPSPTNPCEGGGDGGGGGPVYQYPP